MKQRISLRDANQRLSEFILRVEQESAEFIITRRGKPIASLTPIFSKPTFTAAQQSAWQRTQERVHTAIHTTITHHPLSETSDAR